MSDTLPIDTDSAARTELNPIARLDTDLQTLATRRKQDEDYQTLLTARAATADEYDRIGLALAAVLVTHPGCCTPRPAGDAA